ncbi:hypothetical protein BOTBODRAFT_185573 [Botryobasidium botryosum FD-172 SS1]|uniref:Uncharacterized protein n=1 Tax=Botryobasidium botryosum (strain FD-172 SS1) TaxID=930990 RepID=A0A067MR51_BOTB1|nr:hypothetical protein BOTBODRAFT_185573 [Botryobasidium botryosum FD-172 SS1]
MDEAQRSSSYDRISVEKGSLGAERLADLCNKVPGYIHCDLEDSEGDADIYYVYGWLLIYEGFGKRDLRWEIHYILWAEFVRIARKDPGSEIREFQNFDLIIMPILSNDLWDAPFGLNTKSNVERCLSAISHLETRYPLWPKLAELLRAGDGLTSARDLDQVAFTMGNARPKTVVPSPYMRLPKRGQVIKRCMSILGYYNIYHKSYIPDQAITFGELPTPDPERAYWYMQEYAPLLRIAGSICILLGRGQSKKPRPWRVLKRIVITPVSRPELDEWMMGEFICPLSFEVLRNLPTHAWTPYTLREDHSNGLTDEEIAARLRPWDDFAAETLKRFVNIEEKRMGPSFSSSLRVLALVEIGFVENSRTNQLDLFMLQATVGHWPKASRIL